MKYYQGHPDLPPTNKNRGEDVTSRLVKTYKPITIKDTPRCDENFTEAKEHGIEIKEVGDIPD